MADDPMGLADEWPAAVMPMIMAGGGRRPEDADQLRKTAATTTASKLRTVVSMLNRTGHARFRRGPVVRETASSSESAAARAPDLKDTSQDGLSLSMASSSFPSGVTGEGSVSNRRALARAAGGNSNVDAVSDNAGAGGKDASRCHCSKKRKPSSSRARARRRIRVPAISLKNADIPPDESSWRKYGQKPIKGSPYPRGYYKCSRVRGCPARKHVERDPSEPAMLIVTYERDHRHGDPAVAAVPENAVLKAIDL